MCLNIDGALCQTLHLGNFPASFGISCWHLLPTPQLSLYVKKFDSRVPIAVAVAGTNLHTLCSTPDFHSTVTATGFCCSHLLLWTELAG